MAAALASTWRLLLDRLDGLPDGDGINIAHEAVDRHLLDGRGDDVAIRFLSKSDTPDAPGEVYTFQRLSIETNRFAHALRSLGVWPGESVFVLAGRIPRLYVAVLGALKGQHVVCPLFSAFGPEPIVQRMVVGHASVLVTTASLYRRKIESIRDRIPARHYVLLDIDDQDDAPHGPSPTAPSSKPDRPISTSLPPTRRPRRCCISRVGPPAPRRGRSTSMPPWRCTG